MSAWPRSDSSNAACRWRWSIRARPGSSPRHLAGWPRPDKIDAAMLAHFAEAIRPAARAVTDDAINRLQSLLARRRPAGGDAPCREAASRQGERSDHPALAQGDDQLIGQAARCDRQGDRPADRGRSGARRGAGAAQVRARHRRRQRPHVACRVARARPRQPARDRGAPSGVAPISRDSGRYRGKRSIQGGQVEVRAPLYMATPVAIRHIPVIRPFYRRLRDAGKPAKVALVACMRKLPTMLNAMLRDRRSWAPAAA